MQPIRMCVVCRKKFAQNTLLRVQCIDNTLVLFTGTKRSFYLCQECLNEDHKRVEKQLARVCRGKVGNLEEFILRSRN
ncbi:MAG: hypothetical protein RBQ81_04890 [Arcobacteraceae bacterium]|nr:hypothetical protein [Arcobacteraceae bacterium]MDY0365177.1 hypothetical protein [Arcobacteraceae bacterium]